MVLPTNHKHEKDQMSLTCKVDHVGSCLANDFEEARLGTGSHLGSYCKIQMRDKDTGEQQQRDMRKVEMSLGR